MLSYVKLLMTKSVKNLIVKSCYPDTVLMTSSLPGRTKTLRTFTTGDASKYLIIFFFFIKSQLTTLISALHHEVMAILGSRFTVSLKQVTQHLWRACKGIKSWPSHRTTYPSRDTEIYTHICLFVFK